MLEKVSADFDVPFFTAEARRVQGPVLELTSGTGRLSVPLIEAGIDLTCVDFSQGMLDVLAQKLAARGLRAELICADVCTLNLPARFDLAILPFQSFMEIVGESRQRAALASVFACLRPGGHFICTMHTPLALMAEPRLPIVRVGPPELLAVLDDRKNSMIPGPSTDRNEGRPYRYYHSGHAATCCDVPVNLVRGKDSRSIAEIRGQVPVTLLLEEKEVVLTDKILQARGKVFESGDLRLTVLSVEKKNPACWTLKLTISSKAAGDDSWSNSLYNRLSLVDSKGQKMGSMGGGWGGNGGVINAEFNYQVTGNDPARLVFMSWTTVAHQVRFEFRNLPLP